MSIPHRTLRETAQRLQTKLHFLSPRDAQQRDRLLQVATELFVEFGPTRFSLAGLAHAIGWSSGKIRRYFSDMESIFAQVLIQYMENLLRELAGLRHAPAASRRALYLDLTRGIGGRHTPMQFLLACQRHCLPPDLLETIQQSRARLIDALGLRDARDLDLMDAEEVNLSNVEQILALVEDTPWRFILEEDDTETAQAPAAETPIPAPKPEARPETRPVLRLHRRPPLQTSAAQPPNRIRPPRRLRATGPSG